MKLLSILMYVFFFLLAGCDNKNKEIITIIKEWEGKEIIFPEHSIFTIQAKDTVEYLVSDATHKILVYVDTVGCTSCRLKLSEWEKWMDEINSLPNSNVKFCIYLFPKTVKEAHSLLWRERFKYPVCIDIHDELNHLNHFPKEDQFQTFLLYKDNKVLVIGNPIHNPAIKKLYLEQITGKKAETQTTNTTATIEQTEINLGETSLSDGKNAIFVLQNTGENPLVITDVASSCGCTKIEYEKEFIKSGAKTQLIVHFTPEEEGFFHKTITVYCNADNAPFKLRIKGNAVK